jgi:hypothetical protein
MGYDVGDKPEVSVIFTTRAGVAADPTGVTCTIETPLGTETTYTYGTDAAVVKDSTGHYHLDVNATDLTSPDGDRIWNYRWRGTGAIVASEEGSFTVRRTHFA